MCTYQVVLRPIYSIINKDQYRYQYLFYKPSLYETVLLSHNFICSSHPNHQDISGRIPFYQLKYLHNHHEYHHEYHQNMHRFAPNSTIGEGVGGFYVCFFWPDFMRYLHLSRGLYFQHIFNDLTIMGANNGVLCCKMGHFCIKMRHKFHPFSK